MRVNYKGLTESAYCKLCQQHTWCAWLS